MKVIIKKLSGPKHLPEEIVLEKTLVLGRDSKVDLVIADQDVSRNHAKLVLDDGGVEIVDLESSNGTLVNQVRVRKKILGDGDVVTIGPFSFQVVLQKDVKDEEEGGGDNAFPEKDDGGRELSDELIDFKVKIHEELLVKADLKRLELSDNSAQLRSMIEAKVKEIVKERKDEIPSGISMDALIKEVLDEALGLGPLEDLIDDPHVTEIMVNHKDQIYIEKGGKLVLTSKRFISDAQIKAVIERIVAPLGRRIDESTPLVDARLKDGSRVNAIIPPLALKGSSITIRKFSKKPFTIDNLIGFGTLGREMALFLELAVKNRQNIVISGGTGSGKTTLLNVVSAFIPEDERIVTVEDAAELKLPQPHVVSLETRPPNIEGKGAITIRDLVKNCLRMRPDRIVVGECRGAEALDMLQAMNTGHDGSLTTGHANSPRDMLSRLETMVLMAGMDLPSRAIREQIASAVSLIVQQSRFPDGSRKITHITEITGMENSIITMQDIFVFQQTGFDDKGKVKGYYKATGLVPKFVEELSARGIEVPIYLFEETDKETKL